MTFGLVIIFLDWSYKHLETQRLIDGRWWCESKDRFSVPYTDQILSGITISSI